MNRRVSEQRLMRVGASAALSVAVGLGVATVAEPVYAQSQQDLERARSLFGEGLSLEAAGNWAAALSKFEDVGRVKLTPQVRFHAARCNEQLGRLSEALGDYRLAEYEAGQEGLSDLSAITQARQALEMRIPKLVIRRGKGAETAHIQLDGVDLGEAQIGQPVPVDPGPHTVTARLTADRQFQQSTLVKESETAQIVLVAPAALVTQGAPASAPVVAAASAPMSDQGASPEASHASPLPWIAGGVGVAGLGAAGAFFLMRSSEKSDLDAVCRGDVCPKSAENDQTKGQLYSTLSAVSLGVGVVGLGVATYLFVSQPSGGDHVAFVPIDVAAGPGGGSVTVRGRF